MATSRMQFIGGQKLGAELRALGNEAGQKICRRATNAAAQPVKKAAVRNIVASPSVRTGELRDSVIIKRIPPGETDLTSEHIVTVRRGKDGAPQAIFVEFGTVRMPAEPFLRPAFESEKERALQAMRQSIATDIAKVNKKAK